MRVLASFGAVAALLTGAATAGAADLKSGLQEGSFVGAFDVVKCAGADDGVREGRQLCYR
ncbi:MAG TPA: hypothetical protein VHC19_14315 [Pirellulales bacterium]|nr:hypothetical protein [Pirellulales bacterium]